MCSNNCKELFEDNSQNLEIHTGNVIEELKRKTALNSTEELLECIKYCLTSCDSSRVEDGTVYCISSKYPVKLNKEERRDIKVTVKVFLGQLDISSLTEAVDKVLNELETDHIESLITALPSNDGQVTLEEIKPVWNVLESLVDQKKVFSIGISDLDTDVLIQLFEWARVKPTINQINLASCCVIPPEMQQFANDNDIQLLTHNDPKELLPPDQLRKWMVSNSYPDVSWKSLWIVRYSALVKCRGVIQNKGYVALLQGL